MKTTVAHLAARNLSLPLGELTREGEKGVCPQNKGSEGGPGSCWFTNSLCGLGQVTSMLASQLSGTYTSWLLAKRFLEVSAAPGFP